MTKQKIDILLDSQAIINAPETYNLNQAILNELNTLIRSQTSYDAGTKKAGTLNGDASVRSGTRQRGSPRTSRSLHGGPSLAWYR